MPDKQPEPSTDGPPQAHTLAPTAEEDIGTSSAIHRLYETRTETDHIKWVEEPPTPPAAEPESVQSPRYAITLYHRPGYETPHPQRIDAMVLRSPVLKAYLDKHIPNLAAHYSEDEAGILLQAPFRLLFWYLDSIVEATRAADSDLAESAQLLHGVLEAEFAELLAKRRAMIALGEINFDTLWTLFKPGITCLTAYIDYTVAVKVLSIDYSRHAMGGMYYRIKYSALAWDGEHLGWQDDYTDIMEFRGRRKIRGLEIVPVEFAADGPALVKEFTARGRKFVDIAVTEPCLRRFSGETLEREKAPMWWMGEMKKKMAERVELDARAYSHYFRRLTVSKFMDRAALAELDRKETADEEIFKYCIPEFHCFALSRKRWTRVWIDSLEDVVFNDTAYPSLVLPGDYKELLLAFAEAQIDGYGFDDVIAGKGQGILMLLAGSPGTGKTLTAEAVAEHMKRPLYSVSAGELGSSAGGMENELDRVLELATRWNAVLLLDEADVFLERRTDNDIQRNSIVSVFLRKLEYYRGIMFLTTNRFSAIDEAFKSRIHVAMRYPDLDVSARRSIWENFLKRAGDIYKHGVDIAPKDIDLLAQKSLNGREIRNIVKSAQLLASRTKQPLQKTHLDIVWKVEHKDSVWQELEGEEEVNGVAHGHH